MHTKCKYMYGAYLNSIKIKIARYSNVKIPKLYKKCNVTAIIYGYGKIQIC